MAARPFEIACRRPNVDLVEERIDAQLRALAPVTIDTQGRLTYQVSGEITDVERGELIVRYCNAGWHSAAFENVTGGINEAMVRYTLQYPRSDA